MQSHRYKTSISLFSINTFLAYFHTVDITSIYLFTRYSMHFPITYTHSDIHSHTQTHTRQESCFYIHIGLMIFIYHVTSYYITSYIIYHTILYLILVCIFLRQGRVLLFSQAP